PTVTQKLITITIVGDTEAEANETFNFVLSNPVGADLGDATGVGTIVDDDAPVLNIGNVSQSEGDAPGTMVFTVTLSKAASGVVTVKYSTEDGTATIGN